jgi:uncharacterized protein
MPIRPFPMFAVAIAALTALALAGCGTDKPTRLYVLSATVEQPAAMSSQGVSIGVGPITLPKYLDRPQIVMGLTANELSQANLDQWGGDLNDNITRVLATNLSNLLATDRVSLYPWTNRVPIDFQVTMDVTNFEVTPDGAAVLSVFWSIQNGADSSVLGMSRSTYRSPVGEPGASGTGTAGGPRPYDAVVAAMSRDLGLLSKDIAAAISARKAS